LGEKDLIVGVSVAGIAARKSQCTRRQMAVQLLENVGFAPGNGMAASLLDPQYLVQGGVALVEAAGTRPETAPQKDAFRGKMRGDPKRGCKPLILLRTDPKLALKWNKRDYRELVRVPGQGS
jgi:hypothetical protein